MTMNERERYIFHIAILQIMKEQQEIPENMFRSVLGRIVEERCRHMKPSDMQEAIEDVGEELMASKNVLGFLEDELNDEATKAISDHNKRILGDKL
jgi:hypothetical protein